MYQLSCIVDHNDEGKDNTPRRNNTPPGKGQGTATPSEASTSGEPTNATTSDGCHRKKKKVKNRKRREGSSKRRKGRESTKQNAVAMLALSDIVGPPLLY
jgi:hypothetical protein